MAKRKTKAAKRGAPISRADAYERAEKAREAAEEASVGCGCGLAGVGIFNDNYEIQRCDDCDLLDSDDEAKDVVEYLLKVLHREHAARGGSVADALERLNKLQWGA